MPWTHTYMPLGFFSVLAAALPFALLCWQLLFRKAGGHIAALTALGGAFLMAVTVWGMPLQNAVSAGLYGAAFGAFPLLWIIIMAMWVYNMTVDSGQFAVVRSSISALTDDRRIQAVFIAFAFGALLECTAGYGAPVAIGAAMLLGLGFPAAQAATLCLIANTVPVAYAGMGLPALTAAQVSELDPFRISQLVSSQLPIVTLFVPLWLSVLVCGWRRSAEIWPVLLTSGLGSAIPTFLFAHYQGYTLPGIMGACGSLLAIVLTLRFWKPARIFRFEGETPASADAGAGTAAPARRDVFLGWLPWLALTLFVVATALGPVRDALNSLFFVRFPWPGLHHMAVKVAPIATAPEPMSAFYTFNLLSSPGTSILAAGLIIPPLMPGYTYARAFKALVRTCVQMRFSILTVLSILALAQLMNYSGMSYTLGLAFTHTGPLFPIFAPMLGWFGVFLTGSDTSSNALFCGMQRATAQAVGMDPSLAVAVNTTGGVTAKMISPQSIAVASGAIGLAGQEGAILRRTIGHSLLMLGMICLLTWLQTNLLSWMV